MIRKFLGIILFLTGLIFAVAAAGSWYSSKDQGGKTVAIVFGAVALFLVLVGYRWMRHNRFNSWRSDPATDRQREFAMELGIKFPKKITKGELSDLISEKTGK